MGVVLRPPAVERRIAVEPDVVWRLLVDVQCWPSWGPSVRRAVIRGGGAVLTAGAQGTVWTPAGIGLPFKITDFVEGRRWSWSVAGVPATGHEVRSVPGGCVVRFSTPWWAAGYLPVCAVALGRIEKLVS